MFDKDLLATFKKHLEGIDDSCRVNVSESCFNKERKIHKFGEDMKSANEFIGALQILDNALAKLIVQIQIVLVDDHFKDSDFKSLEGIVLKEINEIVQKCSFMGTLLFGSTLSVFSGKEEIIVEVFNPLDFFDNGGYENVCAYLEDKRAELDNCLKLVSAKISGQQIFGSDSSDAVSYDNFNAKDFLKMF
ncbi:flagellar FLiS export co-chaperone [Helicobacter cappadocius]|uniref:Flagellar FLiS export co-chaperone n=1 Tax=Helicobacter cappadocius TaxID=3063998 RepID=A0AA90PJB9_9HELI|nr:MULTISPECIES: flagellar FLiS export co-chaperone [unclassified Helicobacter]MDO7252848.1 flagellar FLiS export co-chaperone [Helicobacter sp. faydin-H75]MDP2538891.1 flagellar FLiS export co-chaperone [Helicobacter sp. faydin-H76]